MLSGMSPLKIAAAIVLAGWVALAVAGYVATARARRQAKAADESTVTIDMSFTRHVGSLLVVVTVALVVWVLLE